MVKIYQNLTFRILVINFMDLIGSTIKSNSRLFKTRLIFSCLCIVLLYSQNAHGLIPSKHSDRNNPAQIVINDTNTYLLAALGIDKADSISRTQRQILLVQRIKIRLAELGIYKGLINGEINTETTRAIRKYQHLSKLPVNGIPSSFLLNHLKSAVSDAQNLLLKLDYARQRQIINARGVVEDVLGSEKVSFDLNIENIEDDCFIKPTTRCLLLLAEVSAKKVEQPDLRDWTLSIVSEGFARTGDIQNALRTARSIIDPRSVVSAISAISIILAEENQASEAITLANRFPNKRMRDRVNKAIGESAAKSGNFDAAMTAARLIKTPQIKFESLVQTAQNALEKQHTSLAHKLLERAQKLLPEIITKTLRDSAFGELALLYEKIGNSKKANRFIKNIENDSIRVKFICKILVEKTSWQSPITSKYFLQQASELTSNITQGPEVDQAKSWLAHAYAVVGDFESAIMHISSIHLGYTHSYALSRVAMVMGEKLSANDASTLAKSINDEQLRVIALLTIAQTRQDLGDHQGAKKIRKEIHIIAMDIRNTLNRVSTIADLSLAEAYAGRDSGIFFEIVLKQLKKLKDHRTRAQLLTKAATTLYVLKAF